MLFQTSSLIFAECRPRNVYVDMGVNWCNTIRLFEDIEYDVNSKDIPLPFSVPYDIYGFEASPLIQPFAEKYFEWLNGEIEDEPVTCLPRSGSTAHLWKYSSIYGCSNSSSDNKMRNCMWKKLEKHLEELKADPSLNATTLIHKRLESASKRCGTSNKNKYTFIPAAVGSSGDGKWLDFYGPPKQLIRGGSIPKNFASSSLQDSRYNFRVNVVNIPLWLERSFLRSDHVFLKMDVEGSEHGILQEMVERGTIHIVDVLSLECHSVKGTSCKKLMKKVQQANPRIRIVREGKEHAGYDSYSKVASMLTKCLIE